MVSAMSLRKVYWPLRLNLHSRVAAKNQILVYQKIERMQWEWYRPKGSKYQIQPNIWKKNSKKNWQVEKWKSSSRIWLKFVMLFWNVQTPTEHAVRSSPVPQLDGYNKFDAHPRGILEILNWLRTIAFSYLLSYHFLFRPLYWVSGT